MQGKPRVMFVDDEQRIVNLLRMMFRGTCEVYTATSGQEALAIAAAHPIDVVVSDQRMPGMSGIELLSQMRERSPATMRVLLTGYSDLAAIVGSVNEGAVFRFINKPWNQDEIRRIVAEAAEAARLTADVAAAAPHGASLPEAPAPHAPGVLLIEDDADDRRAIIESIGGQFTVHGVADIRSALGVLEERDIGVIVSEARVGGTDVGEFLRVLKRHHPAVTTVMLTSAADADLVIQLINKAQIFRFGTKPVRGSAFRLAVAAAMREHGRMRAHPVLARRHAVEASGEAESPSLVGGILASLARMRSRLGWGASGA
ncbi:MAG: response regulator [Variovorax sp.]|nr:response regulator [Variovorax sp.]